MKRQRLAINPWALVVAVAAYAVLLILASASTVPWAVPAASGQTVPPSGPVSIFLPFIPKPLCSPPLLAPVIWDSRLGPGGLPHLQNVRIIPANPAPCQTFWRAVKVLFQDYYESGNDHTIYVKLVDENGVQVFGNTLEVRSESGLPSEYPQEKLPGDLCDCNFDYPLYGDAYDVQVISASIPSDTVAGMVMPLNRHVNYLITFQRVVNPP